MKSFTNKSFLKLLDLTGDEIQFLVDLSLKMDGYRNYNTPCATKNMALIFEKTSTRTRCSFEVACADLAINTVYLDPSTSQLGKKESVKDTARVLGQMFDAICYRGYGQERVQALADYSGLPVFNALTNESHPTQIIADFAVVQKTFGKLKGVTLVYFGDARYNMGNSLMVGCAKVGMNFVACCPKEYNPDGELIKTCREFAKETGATITFCEDPIEAAKLADVIYTDVWVSMGEPDAVWEKRIKDLLPYQVNMDVIKNSKVKIVLHCLPSFHNLETEIGLNVYNKYGLKELEITDEVFEMFKDSIFEEAKFRLLSIKAIILATLSDEDFDPFKA